MTQDLLLLAVQDFVGWSSDPARPDYACPAYRAMAPRWQLVHDVRAGTPAIRAKRQVYLPRFEAETMVDWNARVQQTFAGEHYATTLTEHVGLVFSQPIKLGDDVPDAIRELIEDFDGEGNHLDVVAQTAFDHALHLGHCVLFTDYPAGDAIRFRSDERRAQVRPYVILYSAADVLSWRTAVVGGVLVLVQIVFRESTSDVVGDFGVTECVRLKEIRQDVTYDPVTGRATVLGAITWRAWECVKPGESSPGTPDATMFVDKGGGEIVGPERIPVRVVYGGEKLGLLTTKPHLFGLALASVEETQVQSDYATVMHKCNVPTPVFIGRQPTSDQTVQMGQGIDIPMGGDAKFLEPSGVALAATRQRLEDIRAQMRRHGATSAEAGEAGKALTATEASIRANQRNAKLLRGARSLQDALEGVLADMAAYLNVAPGRPTLEGGSVAINQDFAGQQIDPALLAVYVNAYTAGGLPLDALLYALEKGSLPDDFSAQDSALQLIAADAANADQATLDAKKLADNAAAPVPAAPAGPAVAGGPS